MLLDQDVLQILAVGCRVAGEADEIGVTEVDSDAAALGAVRLMQFDLLLTTSRIGGGDAAAVWPLARKLRTVRPRLLWWLIAGGLTDDEEILARTLGVTRILETTPTAELVRSALCGNRPAARRSNAAPRSLMSSV